MEPAEKDAIRAKIDLVEFISRYTTLKKAGGSWKGLCPFHNEKTPSFTVEPDKGFWRCYGACSTGGDLFSFLMKAENLSFPEAVERLAQIAGVTLTRRGMDREQAQRQQDEKDQLYAVNAEAMRFYQQCLQRARLAQDYIQERGLAHETLQRFGIGFAPDEWSALSRHLATRNYAMADAEQAGLNRPSQRSGEYTDQFRGRLIFPIYDVQERVVAFGGRIIPNPALPPDTNVGPKYLNSRETPVFSKSRVLYGLSLPGRKGASQAISQEDRVLVVEGYMDVVAAHQAGIENVVATLGTSLTEEHIRLLGRRTKTILLSFDADDAGIRAALRAAELFQQQETPFNLRILTMPPGDDPDSMLRRGDIAGFRRAMDTACTVPEFRLRALERRFDLKDESGRIAYLTEAIPILTEVRSSLELDLLVRRLAPYHPSFGQGTRAETTILAEVKRLQNGRSPALPDDTLTPVAHRPPNTGGQRRYPPRQGERPNGYQSRYPQRYEPRQSVPPQPPPSMLGQLSAIQRAERLVLRGLLDEAYTRQVLDGLGTTSPQELLPTAQSAELVAALLPLLQGRYTARRALDALTDITLADYASNFAVARPDEEPLSEDAIDEALRRLRDHTIETRSQHLKEQLTHGADAEALARYFALKKAQKNQPAAE